MQKSPKKKYSVSMRADEWQYLRRMADAAQQPISVYVRTKSLEGTARWEVLMRRQEQRINVVTGHVVLAMDMLDTVRQLLAQGDLPPGAREQVVEIGHAAQRLCRRAGREEARVWH